MRDTLLWLVDSGAEGHLAVSIGSLRLAARALWRSIAKVVVDCGLSRPMLAFLTTAASEGVYVIPISSISDELRGATRPGILPMRTRIRTPWFLEQLCGAGTLPPSRVCLVCDSDTVFLREFRLLRPSPNSDLLVMQEWDNQNGVEKPMLLMRQSTFAIPLAEVPLAKMSEALDLPEGTLRDMPTYNTGVFAFAVGARFTDAWNHEYEQIISLRDDAGRMVFSSFAAEQNALSVAIQRGTIVPSPLTRRFNQFPPRPPYGWPADTAIAHFITFGRNHGEARYKPWFDARESVRASGWVPEPLLPSFQGHHGGNES